MAFPDVKVYRYDDDYDEYLARINNKCIDCGYPGGSSTAYEMKIDEEWKALCYCCMGARYGAHKSCLSVASKCVVHSNPPRRV